MTKPTLLQKRVGALLFAADNITRQTQQVRHMAATENLLIKQRARINASANSADEIVNTLLAMAEEIQHDEEKAMLLGPELSPRIAAALISRVERQHAIDLIAGRIWFKGYGEHRGQTIDEWPEGVVGQSADIFRRYAEAALMEIDAIARDAQPVVTGVDLAKPGSDRTVLHSSDGMFHCTVEHAAEVAYMVNMIEGAFNSGGDMRELGEVFMLYCNGEEDAAGVIKIIAEQWLPDAGDTP